MEERKGFFTQEQEQKLDELMKMEGIYEKTDGVVIKLTDNIIMEKLKAKLNEKNPEIVESIESVIDMIFESL